MVDMGELVVDRTLSNESIASGNELFYKFPALDPVSGYELKLSYLGSPPAQYELTLVKKPSSSRRKLQDTEKIMFTTNAASLPIQLADENDATVGVVVKLTSVGVPQDAEAWNTRHFNIKLEKLHFGVVPQAVLPLVAVIVVGLALGLYTMYQIETTNFSKRNRE